MLFRSAKDYGFVYWSHASGWAASLSANRNRSYSFNQVPSRSFGDDNGSEMALTELEQSLPNNFFSFAYFDVCYASCIEVAYQLKSKFKYFIANPSLMPGYGMPYDLNIPEMCKTTPNYIQICTNTFEYYNAKSGFNKSVAMCLVDCNRLNDIASICRKIIKNTEPAININDMQKYMVSVPVTLPLSYLTVRDSE